MRVIIAAAGEGKRFKDAGYKVPKPLIYVRGITNLDHVVNMVSAVDPWPTVLCRSEHQDTILRTVQRRIQTIPVCIQQQGAALSVLCANGHITDIAPVMVVDLDNVIDQEEFDKFAAAAQTNVMAGNNTMLTSIDNSEHTGYSFIHGYGGKIGYVREKQRVSDRIYCGSMVVHSWAALRRAICEMVADDERTNGEFYMAPAINHVAGHNLYHDIPLRAFHTFGTPKALEEYNNAN